SMFFWPTTLYDHDHFLFKKICIIFKNVRSLHRIWPIESIITAIIKQTPTKTINKIYIINILYLCILNFSSRRKNHRTSYLLIRE
ncbi:hypothetical protein BL386_17640, partial [Salmonella enterica subsp. enterica serovar Johannesburg]|nr:hypothetical protein [Salmonella enterica subsp. enterica serovar Johannesburg]